MTRARGILTRGALWGVALWSALPAPLAAEPDGLGASTAAAVDAAGSEGAGADPLARLAEAVRAHPEDPDLLWALARELGAAGRYAEAADAFARYEARWPGRRPDAFLERGRALYEAGSDEAALVALERALRRNHRDAAAQLYRGLALRRLGRPSEAERALRAAAELDSSLAPETLLLRGLSLLEAGDRRGAERLLRDAIELDPASEIAARAERVLRGDPDTRARTFELYAEAGFEYDTNVTLEGNDLPGPSTGRGDARWLFAGGVNWRPIRGESESLVLGYRFDQTLHDELEAFDLRSHLLFASGARRTSPRTAVRLDAFAADSHLDDEPYLRRAAARPNLLVELGPRAGLLRLFAEGERREYQEDALLESLERDAWVVASGLEHYVPLPRPLREGSLSALGLRWQRTLTEGSRDRFGLDSAFDHDLFEASLRLDLPLPWKLEASAALSFGIERYANDSVIDFLTDGGIGSLDPVRRKDLVLDSRLALARPLTRFTDLELAWRHTDRHSNVDLYAYDRNVMGVFLRLHTF